MSQRVTTECVTTEQNDVDREHNRANANAERTPAARHIDKPECFPNIIGQDQNEKKREIKKVAVNVLHDERERTFAEISFARFADRAGRRVCPKRFVISATIIITGEPKFARSPQNQKRGRKNKPRGPPVWLRAEPTVRRIAKNFRRIKRRDIVAKMIMGSLKCSPG